MNAYMKPFAISADHQLRIYPSVNNISWAQARILNRLNVLFENHCLDLEANLQSDFFLPKLVQGMLCTNVEYAKFSYEDSENATYTAMVSSGLINGGINVQVQLVNDSIIMTFGVGKHDVSADAPLVVYIQAVSKDIEVLPTVPDLDLVSNDLHLVGAFFATGLIEIDPAVHTYDYLDMIADKKRQPHFVDLLKGLNVNPVNYLANADMAKKLWEEIEKVYSDRLVDSGLYAPNYDIARNSDGFWEIRVDSPEHVIHSISISEPELLINFHPNGYAINRFIALKTAVDTIRVDGRLGK